MSSECGLTTTDLFSTNRWQIVMERFPATEFFTNRVPIPSVTLGTTIQATNCEVDIKLPGDKLEYEDLILSVQLDEHFQGYCEILSWINWAVKNENNNEETFSDISIMLNTVHDTTSKVLTFYNCFPYTMSNIMLDHTETEDQILTYDVMFKYTHFDIK